MNKNTSFDDVAEALLRLRVAFQRHGLEPPTLLTYEKTPVSKRSEAYMSLRHSAPSDGIVSYNPKLRHKMTIMGCTIDFEPGN